MNYLANTYFFNHESPAVLDFVATHTSEANSPKEKAIRLFYAVRDGWKYDATKLFFQKDKWRTSSILERSSAHCLDKANVLLTACRACQIPARMHLVKVKNHIAVERIVERFKTDELTPHAYAEVYLKGKWVPVTPTFNSTLCEKLNVAPLEWDGSSAALFQEYNRSGKQFMEYLADYGHYDDLPLAFIYQNMIEHYPQIKQYVKEGVFELK